MIIKAWKIKTKVLVVIFIYSTYLRINQLDI